MANLKIPKRYEEALAKIRQLPDESVQELLTALQEIPNTISASSLSLTVAEQVDTIAASDVEEVMSALIFFYSYRNHFEADSTDAARDIVRALEKDDPGESKRSPEELTAFEDRLARLLDVSRFHDTARAGELLMENEHSLLEARIVTDLRPVFERDHPEAAPTGALVVHMLKIVFRADNTTKNFFVALDTNDVRELMEQLERADAKAGSLKAVLEAAGVPYIDAK